MCVEEQIIELLRIAQSDTGSFTRFRTGARTRAVIATGQGVAHRYQDQHTRVVVKWYKGKNDTSGSRQYQHYHRTAFHTLPTLFDNDRVQQSVTGGFTEGIGPYSVAQYVEGEKLSSYLERTTLDRQQATHILREIIADIWIPLWDGALRFKDCHPGNFVLTPDLQVVMIDTEQMRKDAAELIHRPQDWTQRNAHEDMGLKRLPGLISRVVQATDLTDCKATLLRKVKASLLKSELPDLLRQLGRQQNTADGTTRALTTLITDLSREGLIE